jgi:AraC-like DNA-binding protein
MKTAMKLDRQLPVIHSMGNLIFDPVWALNKHKSGDCELLHIISGSVDIVFERKRISAGEGGTILIPSKTMHRDEFDFGRGLKVFMIHFSWVCEEDYFSRIMRKPLTELSKPKKESIAKLIQQFRCVFTGGHDLIMRAHLCEILMRILAVVEQEKDKDSGQSEKTETEKQHRDWVVSGVKAYLEENYSRPMTLEKIAGHVNMSPFHLCRIFSRENDFTIFEYLTQLRMNKAQSLLEEGRLSISEIAYAVGFNNSNYFSKVFHRYFGFPPKKIYRKKYSFKTT